MVACVVLDAATAARIRGKTGINTSLEPVPLADGTYVLPVHCFSDPAHAVALSALKLGALPRLDTEKLDPLLVKYSNLDAEAGKYESLDVKALPVVTVKQDQFWVDPELVKQLAAEEAELAAIKEAEALAVDPVIVDPPPDLMP